MTEPNLIPKRRRQQAIRDLLDRNEIHTQEQLEALLEAEGISVAQATLSRDLRELGASKGPDGYQLSTIDPLGPDGSRSLEAALRACVLRIDSGGSVLVLRTRPGMAGGVATAIDEAGLPQVLGVAAGVDSVLVAARSTTQAGELRWRLRRLVRQ